MNTIRKKAAGIFMVILAVVCTMGIYYVANAQEELLTTQETVVYQGDTIVLSGFLSEEEEIMNIRYEIAEYSENASSVSWKEEGVLCADAAGKAVIRVIYTTVEQAEEIAEELNVEVRAPEELKLSYGETKELLAAEVYNSSDMLYTASNDSLSLSDDKVTVQGFESGSIYVSHNQNQVLVAQIEVQIPFFEREHMTRATQTDAVAFPISNYTALEEDKAIQWETKDAAVAVPMTGGIQAKAEGTTGLSAVITARNGQKMVLEGELTVTNPAFTQDRVVVAVDGKVSLSYTGTSKYSTYGVADITPEENSISGSTTTGDYAETVRCAKFISKKKITGVYEGMETIPWVVDGRTLTIEAVVTNPRAEYLALSIQKGKKKNLGITGLNEEYSSITYASMKESMASVSSNGTVTAKTVGNVKIKVKADGKTFKVCVEICTKKAYNASKKAIAISNTKTEYSQTKRMQSGYYDCSSLVSRVYRKYGVYFGVKSGWSPTAADIGRWCANNGKVIAKKGISYEKLVPGDVVFYSYSENGRYRNISHVEIYVGNGMSVSASSRNNRVIHYGYSQYKVVLIARPTV